VEFLSERFGKISYSEGDLLHFPQGLVGFPGLTRYFLFEEERLLPLVWLHSIDDPNLAFLVCDPLTFCDAYQEHLHVPPSVRRQLGEPEDYSVLAIVTPQAVFSRSTINLLGPLVVNANSRSGFQLILDDESLSTRHPLFPVPEAPRAQAALAV
jgi:flagellar assembly factor FliW